MFHHRSLDTKIDMERVRFTEIDKDFFPTKRGIPAFTAFLKRQSIGDRAIHLVMTHGTDDGGGAGFLGIANVMSMCDPNENTVALTKYFEDEINTAQTVAHEIGHVLGMFHDFESPMDVSW